nr:reverse transcriptase domain-containing protein [Tanacetum cinerariifolium]
MLRACPHHGFSDLTQIDTFYNDLNEQDQDSLNTAAGGNLLSKTTRDALKIIKNKSKVRYSISKMNVSRVNTNSRDSINKTDDRIDKLADQISNLVEIVNKKIITLATTKAVEKTYVICGGERKLRKGQNWIKTGQKREASLGFDQPQPPQSPVIHQPPQELSIQGMEDLKQQYLDELKHLSNLKYRDKNKIAKLTKNFNDQFEDLFEYNEEFSSIDDNCFSLDNIDYVEASPPDSELIRSEVDAFLAVEDEPISSQFPKSYLDPEGDIFLLEAFLNDDHSFDFKTKSSFTSLNPLLEETNNFDNSLPEFIIFSNVLFDAEYESDSSDDQSCFDEVVLEKIVSKPLFKEEIIPMKIDLHPDNGKSDLMESLRTHDSSLLISSKIDSLLDEFVGELALLKSIPSGIDKTNCHPEEETHFTKKLLYDNSSPRPLKEFVFENSNADIESFSPSPIPIKDSDSHMEEIDLSFNLDDPMPSGIEEDDHDSKRDIPILEELLDNYSFSLPKNESCHFDIPSPYRPPAKPPDSNTGILNIKMMGDISD